MRYPETPGHMVADQERAEPADGNRERTLHPSVRPPLLSMLLLVIVGLVLVAGIGAVDVGSDLQSTLTWVLALLVVVLLVRSAARVLVLTRTRYVVTPTQLRREFEMLYRKRVREVPLTQLRGIELRRGTIQTFFGFGDLQFLTAGTNQSLGFLSFDQIPDPDEVRDEIRDIVDDGRATDRAGKAADRERAEDTAAAPAEAKP